MNSNQCNIHQFDSHQLSLIRIIDSYLFKPCRSYVLMVDLIMIAHSCLVANEKIACICLWLESVEQSHRSLKSLRSVLLSLSMSDNSSSTTTCLANSSSSSKSKRACTCSKCMRASILRSVRLAHQHAMDALDYTTQFINDTDRKIKKKRKRKGKNKKAGG